MPFDKKGGPPQRHREESKSYIGVSSSFVMPALEAGIHGFFGAGTQKVVDTQWNLIRG